MSELALAGAVTETGLDLPPDLSFEEWAQTGETLGRIGRACQWWLGDWLDYGERAYGEKYAQAANLTGYDEQSLMNMQWVARGVETSRRRESLAWSHHAEVASLEPAEQDSWLDRAEAEDWTRNDLRKEVRRPKLAAAVDLPAGTYGVLYADPPWRYEHVPVSDSRAVENQYPTLELDEIKALAVPAADDAVLFLWATSPKLTEALEVVAAWGFEYRTCMVWVKDRIGMGYYARQRHELVLICKRGDPAMPAEGDRPDSVIEAPRGRHSEKPGQVYELIERMYPDVPKLELFARSSRPGWESWGNEAIAA